MKLSEKAIDRLVAFEALGWLIVVVACMTGFGWASMWVVGFMVAAHMLVGSVHNNGVHKKFLIYPIALWLAVFLISMAGMQYYYFLFWDSPSTFLILGMHPSSFYMHVVYWWCSIACVPVGLILHTKYWLPDEAWERFEKEANLKKEETTR